MNSRIEQLLEKQIELLTQINQKLSNSTYISAISLEAFNCPTEQVTLSVSEESLIGNISILIANEMDMQNAIFSRSNDKITATNKNGQVLIIDQDTITNPQSSFIDSVIFHASEIQVNIRHKYNIKKYFYSTDTKQELNRVKKQLMSATRLSKPFITELKNNKKFSYKTK